MLFVEWLEKNDFIKTIPFSYPFLPITVKKYYDSKESFCEEVKGYYHRNNTALVDMGVLMFIWRDGSTEAMMFYKPDTIYDGWEEYSWNVWGTAVNKKYKNGR